MVNSKKTLLITDKDACSGGVALEMLVSLGILALVLSSSIALIFGNQSLAIDTETNSEAIMIAEKLLEETRASSKADFNSIASASFTQSIYTANLNVFDITPCRKYVTSEASWPVPPSRNQNILLSTILTGVDEILSLGGNCDVDGPRSNWENPDTLSSINLGIAGLKASDVDTAIVAGKRWAFVTSISGNQGHDDFWVVDVSDINNPQVVASLNAEGCRKGGAANECGLNALVVAGDYAYAANASSTIVSSSEELMVIDISDPLSPALVGSATLGIVPNCLSPQSAYCPGGARSIYYYDAKIYIGTHRIGGHEFHIFDVTDPADPVNLGSKKIDRNVNDIIVRDGLAYLATSASNSEILLIYDVSDPTDISFVGSFFAEGNEDGQALYLLGNKIYLGRDRAPSSRPDFYIIDISEPSNPVSLGSKNLSLNPNTAVVGVVVSGHLAFIATTNQTSGFHVWDISDPDNIKAPSGCNLYKYPLKATGIDFADNLVFVSNESNYALRIIEDNMSSICSE